MAGNKADKGNDDVNSNTAETDGKDVDQQESNQPDKNNIDDNINIDTNTENAKEAKKDEIHKQIIDNDETGKNQIDSQKKKNAYKKNSVKADYQTSGTLGTSKWRLDEQGVLHFEAGTFMDWSETESYWDMVGNDDYIQKIIFDGQVKAGKSATYLFADLRNLTSIENADNFDLSDATDLHNLFENDGKLKSIDESNWDTSNVTDMHDMFNQCTALTHLDVTNWDTSSVTNMEHMFINCRALTHLDVTNWDTSSVTNMRSLFNGCRALTDLNVTNWDTSSVTDMDAVFNDCSALTSLNVVNWDTSNVTIMAAMFQDCSALTSLDVSNFDTSNVTTMALMFNNCSALTSLDLSGFDTSNVTDMMDMLQQTELFQIKLGKNFKFQSDVGLPNLTSSSSYTGKWVNVGTGSITAPTGNNIWTSDELVANYNGSTDSDWYVWQPRVSQASIEGHDSTIVAGPDSKWSASDNFDGGTDADGNPLDLNEVTVKGTVNPQVAGDYQVTYSYTDGYGNTVSKTVTVHVIASQASIEGHDSTIVAGPDSKWSASDNFDGATDAEGNPLDLNEVTVKGTVNPQVAGDYQVTYSYTDGYGNTVSKTVTVHVIASQNPDTPDIPNKPGTPDTPDTPNKPDTPNVPVTPMKPTQSNQTISESSESAKNAGNTSVNVVSASKQKINSNAPSKMNTLPQTGEKDSDPEITMGILGLLASIISLFGLSKRRRNKED